MKKSNILILSHDYYPNNIWGTGKNVYDFIENSYHKYNIVLYTAFPRDDNLNYKLISPNQILFDIFVKGFYIKNNSYRDTNLLQALNILMIKNISNYYESIGQRPDIILNHGWMTFPIAHFLSKKYNIKIISFVHFYEKQFLSSNNLSTKTDWKDIYKIENSMFNKSDKIVVFSENQKNNLSLLYQFDSSKLKVVPHSIILPDISVKKSIDSKIKILFVGRLIEDKGIKELIEVFTMLCKKYENLELNIVGEGILRKDIEALHIKNVNVLGYLTGKELYENYILNDIFCLPTKTETFGLVLLEAMNYKIPIITTEGESVSNIIKNSETGLTIKLQKKNDKYFIDKFELYRKIEELITNKKLQRYLSNNAFNEYNNLYKKNEFDNICKLIGEVLDE